MSHPFHFRPHRNLIFVVFLRQAFYDGGNIGKGWIFNNIPDLFDKYSTVMRYKAAAKKLKQIAGLTDQTPAEVVLPKEAEERPTEGKCDYGADEKKSWWRRVEKMRKGAEKNGKTRERVGKVRKRRGKDVKGARKGRKDPGKGGETNE